MNQFFLTITLVSLLTVITTTYSAQVLSEPEGSGSDKKSEKVDYLGLAALLMQGGNFERAQLAIANVDTSGKKLDKVRYHTLKGLISLNLGEYSDAVTDFDAAIAIGQTSEKVYLYLAQAHFKNKSYQDTLNALQNTPTLRSEQPDIYLLESQAYWELEQKENSWSALTAGQEAYPSNDTFLKRRIFLLIQLGLYQKASELGLDFLDKFDPKAEDYIAIGNALRQSAQPRYALTFLEPAHLKFPSNTQVMLVLAQTYKDMTMNASAAHMLEKAAKIEDRYLVDAAEMNRLAGAHARAQYLNSLVPDSEKKYKQRLALFLDDKMYTEIMAMEETLYRSGLLKYDDIRYAVAYASLMTGDIQKAESHLDKITKSSLFRKSIALRKAIERCQENSWSCGS